MNASRTPKRLTIPAALVVTTLAAAAALVESCTSCPDPQDCYSELVPNGDGGYTTAYFRRDGSVSNAPCPPVPAGCPVV